MKNGLLFLIILSLFSCSGERKKDKKQELFVFAAASLTDVITELAEVFEQDNGVKVKLNFAASGTLARQIDQGAEADVYISANEKWMDFLVEKQKAKETKAFAKNDLVLISPLNMEFRIEKVDSLLRVTKGKIAVGDPGYVPAGKYAGQVFRFYKLNLNDRLLMGQDVRSALMMVELGEAEFGIVYKTDAVLSKKVRVVYTFPDQSHDPVEYYQVLISENKLAKQFYDYLYSEKAKKVITDYSFLTD